MIIERDWILSKVRVADLGYVPQYDRVLLKTGELAEFRDVEGGDWIVWWLLDTNGLGWVLCEDICLDDIAGVVIPSYVESVAEFEERTIDRVVEALTDPNGKPYSILVYDPNVAVTVNRIHQRARERAVEG